jgi:hypothetical protein
MPSITPQRLLHFTLLLLTLIALILSPQIWANFCRNVRHARTGVVLIVFSIAWWTIAAIASEQTAWSFYRLANDISMVAMFFVVLAAVRSERDIVRLIVVLMAAGLISVGVGSIEAIVRHNLFLKYFTPTNEYVEWALSNKERMGFYRVQSTFGYPIVFSEFLTLIVPLSAGAFLFFQTSRLVRGMAVLLIACAPIMIYLSGSRSGIVGVTIAFTLVPLYFAVRKIAERQLRLHHVVVFTLVGVVGVIGLWFMLSYIVDIVVGQRADIASTHARVTMLQRGMKLVFEQPIVGYGPGLAAFVLGFRSGTGNFIIDNYFLSLALDAGIPATLLFIAFSGYFFWLGFRLSLRGMTSNARLSGMLAIALLAFMPFKLIISVPDNFPFYYFLLGAISVMHAQRSTDAPGKVGK